MTSAAKSLGTELYFCVKYGGELVTEYHKVHCVYLFLSLHEVCKQDEIGNITATDVNL